MKYVLDTHPLIWFIEGNSRLGQNAFAVLSDPSNALILPAIALAEAVWIIAHGKTAISSVDVFLNAIDQDSRITMYPLDRVVINETLALSEIHEMHDRQIVATAIALQNQGETVALLSCDRNITNSGVVPLVW